jgi:1,4-alpha-glucan branching enzyme
MVSKMPGPDEEKFATLRALYGFQWGHPGKKLLFMGGEMAQWTEWDVDGELDWPLLDFDTHQGVRLLVSDLNRVYKQEPALHALDFHPTVSSGWTATTVTGSSCRGCGGHRNGRTTSPWWSTSRPCLAPISSFPCHSPDRTGS